MKLCVVLGLAVLLPGCSSNPNASPLAQDAASDALTPDAGPDVAEPGDCGCVQEAMPVVDAAAADAACPMSWSIQPTVDPTIAVPPDGGSVLLHAIGTGTQNYACEPGSDGGLGWTFVGPQADLSDCHGNVIGHHFASEAGAAAPEWMLLADGSYAIGQKVAAFDGGAASIPWLLLRVASDSDAGTLRATTYVQRIDTDGGLQPTSSCDIDGGLQMVPYEADYYFYAP
jgi:hypothetical protein